MSYVFSLSMILVLIICAIPGIYFARKNYVYTYNPKYNTFIFRLFITLPFTFLFNVVFILIAEDLVGFVFPSFYGLLKNIVGEYSSCVFSLFFSLLIILYLKLVLTPELPDFVLRDENETPLYIYLPTHLVHEKSETKYQSETIHREDSDKGYNVKIKNPRELLIINDDDFISETIGLTRFGHLIATEYAINVLKEHQISNFTVRPVQQKRRDFSKRHVSDLKCFQIIVPNEMPPASAPTVIDRDKNSQLIALKDFKMYYHQEVMENVCDLSRTYEYFGSDLYVAVNCNHHFQYLVVTQKVKDIFIHQLGQNEWDFKTVYLTDDDGNILKS